MTKKNENLSSDAELLRPILQFLEGESGDRDIYLFDKVKQKSILKVIRQIHTMERRDSKRDIYLYINSDGGSVSDCFALIDVMDASPCDIVTVVLGQAASAACIIASNGTPMKRFGGKSAEFMFHEIYGDIVDAKYTNMEYYKRDFKRTLGRVNKIVARNTGLTVKDIMEIFYKPSIEDWMKASEAKKLGLIDHILRSKATSTHRIIRNGRPKRRAKRNRD